MSTPFATDRPLVGLGLKMYFSAAETKQYLSDLVDRVGSLEEVTSGQVQLIVFPGFLSLPACGAILGETPIAWGAQNVYFEPRGAFTGEVSIRELLDVSCSAVEVGHMERIKIFGETPDLIAKKITTALRHGLTPFVCVGENSSGAFDDAAAEVLQQIEAFTGPARAEGLTGQVVYAYEPYWAIGADKPASPDYVVEVSQRIREGLGSSDTSVLIYGGTAGPGLLPHIYPAAGGLFLGRLAHDLDNVYAVVKEAAALVS